MQPLQRAQFYWISFIFAVNAPFKLINCCIMCLACVKLPMPNSLAIYRQGTEKAENTKLQGFETLIKDA